MTYKEHKYFEPLEDNHIIWRYMDFTKFIDLINKKKLFFCRIDKLQDKFEGSTTNSNLINAENNMYKGLQNYNMPLDTQENCVKGRQLFNKYLHEIWVRKSNFVNCWHINEIESSAMWDVYCGRGNGIAIKSTFGRLKRAFDKFEKNVYIGKVNYDIDYIDPNNQGISEKNLFNYVLNKQKFFEYENELRCVISKKIEVFKNVEIIELSPENMAKKFAEIKEIPIDQGIYADIDLNLLIEKIVISPHSEKWFKKILESESESILDKFEIDKNKLEHSKIARKALY